MSTGPKFVASKPIEANRARSEALQSIPVMSEKEYFGQLDANPAARNTDQLIERTQGALTWWTYPA